MFSKSCFKSFPYAINPPYKVLIGADVSFPHLERVGGWGPNVPFKGFKERFKYYDIFDIYEIFDDFCILTLKEVYDGPVSPLCLPEINNNHYEKIDDAKIYGLGYPKYFGDKVRSWLIKKPVKQRIERKMHLSKDFDVKSSSQCAQEFGTWALKRKGGGYAWLEK